MSEPSWSSLLALAPITKRLVSAGASPRRLLHTARALRRTVLEDALGSFGLRVAAFEEVGDADASPSSDAAMLALLDAGLAVAERTGAVIGFEEESEGQVFVIQRSNGSDSGRLLLLEDVLSRDLSNVLVRWLPGESKLEAVVRRLPRLAGLVRATPEHLRALDGMTFPHLREISAQASFEIDFARLARAAPHVQKLWLEDICEEEAEYDALAAEGLHLLENLSEVEVQRYEAELPLPERIAGGFGRELSLLPKLCRLTLDVFLAPSIAEAFFEAFESAPRVLQRLSLGLGLPIGSAHESWGDRPAFLTWVETLARLERLEVRMLPWQAGWELDLSRLGRLREVRWQVHRADGDAAFERRVLRPPLPSRLRLVVS